MRATYGILLSRDAGKSWSWICEGAVGYGNVEDPMMAFTADGTILAGIFEGLSVGQPDGCTWAFAPGGLADKYVIDLALEKADASPGVLIISNSVGQDAAGRPSSSPALADRRQRQGPGPRPASISRRSFLGLTADTAPSNPQRVYLSGPLRPARLPPA